MADNFGEGPAMPLWRFCSERLFIAIRRLIHGQVGTFRFDGFYDLPTKDTWENDVPFNFKVPELLSG
jgi:hypothetical protein